MTSCVFILQKNVAVVGEILAFRIFAACGIQFSHALSVVVVVASAEPVH